MSVIKTTGEKKLMLFSGRAHPELAEQVAIELGIELTPTTAYDFANGEIYVRFEESVRGCDAFVLQSCTSPINTWIMETLIMVDALKRASAKRITVVLPFFPYARQDKKHRGREPISARLMADLFETAGADRHDGGRPAHRADPGLLRRPGRPPLRAAAARRPTSSAGSTTRTSPSSRRTPAGCGSPSAGPRRCAARRSRSSTRRRDPDRPNQVNGEPGRR